MGLGCAPQKKRPEALQPSADNDAPENLLLNVSITNEVPELRRLRREIEAKLSDTPAQAIISNICLAVDEATQNIIRHAFQDDTSGRINITAHIADSRLHVSITDTAPLIDLDKVKPRDLDELREGGLGTHFIMEITEEARWSHDGGQNRLDMVFAL